MCVNEGYLLGSPKHFTFLPQKLMESGYLLHHPPGGTWPELVFSGCFCPRSSYTHLTAFGWMTQRMFSCAKDSWFKGSKIFMFAQFWVRCSDGGPEICCGEFVTWDSPEVAFGGSKSKLFLQLSDSMNVFCFLNTIAVMECKKGMGSEWPGWQE